MVNDLLGDDPYGDEYGDETYTGGREQEAAYDFM
jgi:hypothetical protein